MYLRNSEGRVPAMKLHTDYGRLEALFIIIFSLLVLHSKCFILRIFVSGSGMQKMKNYEPFHRKCLLIWLQISPRFRFWLALIAEVKRVRWWRQGRYYPSTPSIDSSLPITRKVYWLDHNDTFKHKAEESFGVQIRVGIFLFWIVPVIVCYPYACMVKIVCRAVNSVPVQ